MIEEKQLSWVSLFHATIFFYFTAFSTFLKLTFSNKNTHQGNMNQPFTYAKLLFFFS